MTAKYGGGRDRCGFMWIPGGYGSRKGSASYCSMQSMRGPVRRPCCLPPAWACHHREAGTHLQRGHLAQRVDGQELGPQLLLFAQGHDLEARLGGCAAGGVLMSACQQHSPGHTALPYLACRTARNATPTTHLLLKRDARNPAGHRGRGGGLGGEVEAERRQQRRQAAGGRGTPGAVGARVTHLQKIRQVRLGCERRSTKSLGGSDSMSAMAELSLPLQLRAKCGNVSWACNGSVANAEADVALDQGLHL